MWSVVGWFLVLTSLFEMDKVCLNLFFHLRRYPYLFFSYDPEPTVKDYVFLFRTIFVFSLGVVLIFV